MEKGIEFLDISGDAGLRVYGDSLEDIFSRSALGLYSLITDITSISAERSIEVNAAGESPEGLLVGWLNELIFQFDTYGFVGVEVQVIELEEKMVRAVLKGSEFNPDIHKRGLLIKAATYHMIKLEEKDGRWIGEVIFDI